MKKLMILGVIILFLFCATKKTTVKTEGIEEVVVFGEEPGVSAQPSQVTPSPIEEVAAPAPRAPATVYGFRVQIFASSTQKGASKVADEARGVFDAKVYIEYTPPYYKVRVGDCLTEEEAEALKNLAIDKGFHGAFVVETMITP